MVYDASSIDREAVLKKIKLILARLLKISKNDNIENLSWDMKSDIFSDIGVDSVDVIDLMYAIEEEFSVKASLNQAKIRRTLGDVVDYVCELIVDQKR